MDNSMRQGMDGNQATFLKAFISYRLVVKMISVLLAENYRLIQRITKLITAELAYFVDFSQEEKTVFSAHHSDILMDDKTLKENASYPLIRAFLSYPDETEFQTECFIVDMKDNDSKPHAMQLKPWIFEYVASQHTRPHSLNIHSDF